MEVPDEPKSTHRESLRQRRQKRVGNKRKIFDRMENRMDAYRPPSVQACSEASALSRMGSRMISRLNYFGIPKRTRRSLHKAETTSESTLVETSIGITSTCYGQAEPAATGDTHSRSVRESEVLLDDLWDMDGEDTSLPSRGTLLGQSISEMMEKLIQEQHDNEEQKRRQLPVSSRHSHDLFTPVFPAEETQQEGDHFKGEQELPCLGFNSNLQADQSREREQSLRAHSTPVLERRHSETESMAISIQDPAVRRRSLLSSC